ncbi:MAG: hypothetical protein QW666_04415 [Candidatus Woesearchaeota archaeon]
MKKYLRQNTNTFDKVEWVKQLASEAIGVSDEAIIRRMLGHLRRKGTCKFNKYGVLQFSQKELVLDQLLKSNEVSPRSAYRWFLLLKAPEEVRELGQDNKISQNEMWRRAQGVLQNSSPEQEKLGKEILQDIIKIVEMM